MRTILALALTILSIFCFIPLGVPAFLLSFIGLKKPMSWTIYKLAQFWARGVILITGCTMDVTGRENIPKKGGVCIVSNHVGMFDIVISLAYIGRPFGFVAKKELLFLPGINMWISILGGLYIDRKNIRAAIKTMNHGIRKIQSGEAMLVFPEGTRSKGRGLLPFRSGAVRLATHSSAPIVPMAITGSFDVFEKDYRVHAVPVRVVFCPAIDTAEISPDDRKHKLAEQVRSTIEEALAGSSLPPPEH